MAHSGGMLPEQEQLAEVKPTPEHEWLAGELRDITNLVENLPLSSIASDGVFESAQALLYWLLARVPAAERHREVEHLRENPDAPRDEAAVTLLDEPDLLLEHGDAGPALTDRTSE